MAIKSGQILHVGNGVTLIERLQTGGPGNLNIPQDRIYELGNYQGVATIRDTPDLTYSMESFDASTDLESFLTALPVNNAGGYDISVVRSVDLATPFKPGKDAPAPFTVTQSVGIPFLFPESISYRFGLRDNANQTVQLRGDSIFYCPGDVYVDQFTGPGAGNSVVTANPAGVYSDASGARRVLSVVVDGVRLSYGSDYTVTPDGGGAGFQAATVTFAATVASTSKIRVMYFSSATHDWPQGVHTSSVVKPAAIRGRDIDVYVGGYDPTSATTWNASQAHKWHSVQSVTCDWKVTLEKDDEFGNYFMVNQDFEVPTVSGGINIKPRSVDELFARIRQATGTTAIDAALGPNTAVPLALDIVLKDGSKAFDPADPAANTLKRLHVPDARFTIPGFSARIQTKLAVDVPWESDGGQLTVYPR